MALAIAIFVFFTGALAWATFSLWLRSRNAGVGSVAGGLLIGFVVLSIATLFMGFVTARLVQPGAEPHWAGGRSLLVLFGVFLVAAAVGVRQGRGFGLSKAEAALGGVADLLFASVSGATLAPFGTPARGEDLQVAIYAFTSILAMMIAPILVKRLPPKPRYPKTFWVPPEP